MVEIVIFLAKYHVKIIQILTNSFNFSFTIFAFRREILRIKEKIEFKNFFDSTS